jgi:hypothetical protein
MSDMPIRIQAALAKLDPANPDHWTNDGAPRMGAVEELVGTKSVTRADVAKAAPNFSRENPVLPGQTAPAAPPEAEEAPGLAAAALAAEIQDSSLADPEGSDQEAPAAEPTFEADDELSELERQVADADVALAKALAEFNAAQRKMREIEAQRDKLIVAKERAAPRHANQIAIMGYIETQVRMRAERAEEMAKAAALAEGVRSPLDAAMARRTGRGGQRPSIPLKR